MFKHRSLFSVAPKPWSLQRSWLHLWRWPLRAVGTAAGRRPGRRHATTPDRRGGWRLEAVGCWKMLKCYMEVGKVSAHFSGRLWLWSIWKIWKKSNTCHWAWGQNFEPCAWHWAAFQSDVDLTGWRPTQVIFPNDLPSSLLVQARIAVSTGQQDSASGWGTLKIP